MKLDKEEDDEDDMDTEDKGQAIIGLDDENVAVKSEVPTIIDEEKLAELKASKSLGERQREFKDMLLERGVRSIYSICRYS